MPKKTKMQVKQKTALTFIIEHIWSHKKSEPFKYPVDYVKLNILDYPSIIKNPMDLSTVMKKLREYAYFFVEDCLRDLELVWQNCLMYNRPSDWIAKSARELWEYQKKLLKNYLLQIYERNYRKKRSKEMDQLNIKKQNHLAQIKEKAENNDCQSNKLKMQQENQYNNMAKLSVTPSQGQIQNQPSLQIETNNHELNPLKYLNPANKFNNLQNSFEEYNTLLRENFLNLLKRCNDCEVSLAFMMIKRRCFQCIEYDNFGNATINLEKVDDFTLELAKNQLLSWNRQEQAECQDV